MSLLTFPDLNVWIAIAAAKHPYHSVAAEWWRREESRICFFRHTQLGFLRLTTTAAIMDGEPLTMAQAWEAYDWFFQDERVAFISEKTDLEGDFRLATAKAKSA